MLDKIKQNIQYEKQLVIIPKSEEIYTDVFKYMYGDCIFIIDDLFNDYSDIVEIINHNVNKIYFINFHQSYRKILPELNKNIHKVELFLSPVANFTNTFVLPTFYDIIEFYERKLIDKLLVLDDGVYEILKKNNYNVEILELKIPINDKLSLKNKNNLTIGILSNDYDPVQNFYNMLTAVSMVKVCDKVKFVSHMNATNNFFKHFNISYEFCSNLEEVMSNNYVNLYCNFTNTNPYIVIKSMDMGIPCIVGNTNIFDDNKSLKKLLVLRSDDDVNEIANKIDQIKENYELIIDEYEKWRKKYE